MGLIPRQLLHVLLLALVYLVMYPATFSHAQSNAPTLPVIQSSFIRSDARITFEWPQPVEFHASAKGKTLTVVFERKTNPEFGDLLAAMYPYVVSAHQKNDGKTIVLTMDKPYKIRTFLSDNVGGIDILNIDMSKRRIAAVKPEESLAALAPSAGTEPATVAAPAENATAPAEKSDSSSIPPEPFPENRTKAEAVEIQREGIKINVSASDDSATLRLPFTERMAIAAYIRNGNLWIVLNKPVLFDLADFSELSKSVIGKAEMVAGSKNILRVPITDDTVKAYVAKEDNSFEWAILLTTSPKTISNPLKININTDPPAPPHVFINSLEMGEPKTFTDPVVGDEVIVTPLYKTGEAIPFARDFVEFGLLETAQGIAVAKKADSVSVISLRNGLRISLPQGGATLTPGLPEVEKNKTTQVLQNVSTLFPYDEWKADSTPSRQKQINLLLNNIANAKDVQEANDNRLRIAQIYLSEGLAAEAIGLLDGINRTSPVFYKSAKLAALRGASNFLMARYSDAAKDFAVSELNSNKEMDYWRSMIADLNGKNGQYSYMDMNVDYISKYPPFFRQKLAIVAADRAVDGKEYNTALKIFESLKTAKAPEKADADKDKKDAIASEPEDILAPINPYVNFLLAKISVDTGQLEDGLTSWNALAEDFKHPFVQARAEFSRVVWQLNHNALTKTQAIDRLERLRIVWHGDLLELKIITLLGDLYFEQKDYVNAMRIWDNGVAAFPNTPNAMQMTSRLEETFILMFGEGSADTLPHVQALSLYYQYKSYAPTGSIGREMIEHLADRLVAVDLLDQATGLLEHQMHFEAEKVQRSQLGAKIATIHLLNNQPKRALNALQDSVYGENPAQLRQLRNRLTAQAYYDLGESDKAYLILGQDDSVDADIIRLNIYWGRKDWKQVIPLVENLLKTRKDISAPITLEESEYVLKLGLAYVFEKNTAQLDYLHDYFTPLMSDNPNKGIFDFITAKDFSPTPTNFDEVVKNLSDTRSFINNYQARIEEKGVSAVVPPVSPK